MSSPPAPALLAALRAGTRDLHERTEAAFVLNAPGVTGAEYAGVLERLLALYAPLEAALDAWAPDLAACGLDLAARRKAPLLRRDRQALGAAGRAADGAARADAPNAADAAAPPLPAAAHALGAAYVLEGATLGGQLLRRRLGPALGLTPARGLAFLSAYGADVGPMWRAFGEAVARFEAALAPAERAAAHAAALAGARDAFLAFERVVVRPTARAAASAEARTAASIAAGAGVGLADAAACPRP